MPPITNLVAEIGVIVYPDVQLAAVYGLTDLFRIAGTMRNCASHRTLRPSG
jgi:transcriptional regulator GlxA family with amidase domain